MLGIAYTDGKLVERSGKMALAWFREAVRNGYVYSYENAGDLLCEGDNTLKRNLLFGLSQYLGAY